jgi:hypothetical protein
MLLLNDYFFAAFWVDLDNPNLSVKAAKAATASRSSGRKRAATAKMQKLKTAQHAAGFSKGQRFTLRRAVKKKKRSTTTCESDAWGAMLPSGAGRSDDNTAACYSLVKNFTAAPPVLALLRVSLTLPNLETVELVLPVGHPQTATQETEIAAGFGAIRPLKRSRASSSLSSPATPTKSKRREMKTAALQTWMPRAVGREARALRRRAKR